MEPAASQRGAPQRGGSIFSSLGVRLFLSLFGVTIVAFTAYAIISTRSASAHSQQTIHAYAIRISDVIERSLNYGMLHDQEDALFHTIRSIARQADVEGIRVYNKSGEIRYSAKEDEIGHVADLRGEACVSCHNDVVPLQAVPAAGRMRVFSRPDGHRVLGLINPIENEPACYTAPCHAHPENKSMLGVLDVTLSMSLEDAQLREAKRRLLIAGVLIALFTGAFSAVFIGAVVRRPVRRLIAGVQRVADGDLETEIDVQGSHELGQLSRAFNAMTHDLRAAREELTNWSDRLETRLQEKSEELSRTQREVIHMEKMASLGKLSATVAHELNNPLAGILNYAKLTERTIVESEGTPLPRDELRRYLQLIQKEAGRSGDIVRNLLAFARRSGAEFARHSLNGIIERSTMLVRHHLEMASIRLETVPLEGDDHLICDADQVQQALIALLVNAVEAMDEGGTLTVAAVGDDDQVRLTVRDTGVGIPESDLPHIFEPFFSSKEQTDGAGLGLAVVYGIVQRHGGKIDVQSDVGVGTAFTLVLPRLPAADARGDKE
jgi:two-component system NtrC family sensor kinase